MEAARKSDLIDLTVQVRARRERAVLVDDGETMDWLPLSQIEIAPTTDGLHWVVTLPEWLAIEKGFV